VDIVVTGRHIQVSDRFRDHLDERLAKVSQLAPKVSRVDVVVTHERATRKSACVELTCREHGRVVRAEACDEDKYVAVDVAVEKLLERLRRASGKRRAAIRGGRDVAAPAGVGDLVATADAVFQDEAVDESPPGRFGAVGDSPIEVREKVHTSAPMTLEEALNRMELVGHDFFLFSDSESGRPSVVYRRRGWSYGVIHLEPGSSADVAATSSENTA
jgi:ribosomal subunit interface protein